ncbi:MAG: hypothetical protein HOM88_06560 [Hellea sp.]|nr:hypothetical protein [Hellea sp.]
MLSVYSCGLLAQDSQSVSNSDDRNLLTEIYDETHTVSNEIFEAKLVGVYVDDPISYKEGYYDDNTIKIQNYYTVDQFTVVRQLPMEVYWTAEETDKTNKDWNKENIFTYAGTEAPSWFKIEFLRGKLLTIKADTTRDYLFSGFSKHDKGKLGTQGMNLSFTSDDEKQFIIETIVGQDDEVYLVLTPSLMESLSMGNLTTNYVGTIQYYYEDYYGRWAWATYDPSRSSHQISNKRFVRSKTYWNIIIDKTSRSTSYSKVPTALLFKLELVE